MKGDIKQCQDNLGAFTSKQQNWRRKVNLGNITMFKKLCSVVEEFNVVELDKNLK